MKLKQFFLSRIFLLSDENFDCPDTVNKMKKNTEKMKKLFF